MQRKMTLPSSYSFAPSSVKPCDLIMASYFPKIDYFFDKYSSGSNSLEGIRI